MKYYRAGFENLFCVGQCC